MDGDLRHDDPGLRAIYRRAGVRTICYVPIVFRDEPLGLLVLYHLDRLRVDGRRDRPRPRLRRPHGDRHRQRPAGRIDADAGRPPAGDLRARRPAQPPPGRRRHRPGDRGRGAAGSSTTTRSGSTGSTTTPGMCEPIAFQGTFLGATDPDPATLRVADRRGPDRLGRRARRVPPARRCRRTTRATLVVRSTDGPESMLARADDLRGTRPRRHRRLEGTGATGSTPDDETTLTIFAGLCRPGAGQRHEHRAAAAPAGRARAPARRPATPARGQRAPAVDARPGRRAGPHRRLAPGDRPVRLADHLPGGPAPPASAARSSRATGSPI